MKYVIAILLLFPFLVFGQENKEAEKRSRFSIGGTFSLDYCYRHGVTNDPFLEKYVLSTFNDIDIPKIGFTTGINILFRLSDRSVLQSGILFSQKGWATRTGPFTFMPPAPVPAPIEVYSNNKYEYIDIPFLFKFYFTNRKFKLFISSGIVLNVFARYCDVVDIYYDDGTKDREVYIGDDYVTFNKLTFGANLGIGVDYAISQKFALTLQPTFGYQFNPIADTPIRYYLYSGGIITGVFYKF